MNQAGSTTRESETRLLRDKQECHELLSRYVTNVDHKRWDALLADCLAPEMEVDYTALRPLQPAGRMKSVDLIAEWRTRMGSVAALQHHFSNIVVDVEGDRATGGASGISTHRNRVSAETDSLWQIAAYYSFGFERTAQGWRINATRIFPRWERTETVPAKSYGA
jgi:hypothetical protein